TIMAGVGQVAMQSDWNLPTAPVQLTTKVERSPADLRQTPDWQSHAMCYSYFFWQTAYTVILSPVGTV
ncbi:hypothetical protein ABZQ89_34400, partial [Pseudomonas aeruginosa]